MDVQTNLEDVPAERLGEDVIQTPHEDEPTMFDDTSRFDWEVNDVLDVDWQGDDLEDAEGDRLMASMVEVLQTRGVSASDAVAYSVKAVKNRRPQSIKFGTVYNPTRMEVYGKGSIVAASHGSR